MAICLVKISMANKTKDGKFSCSHCGKIYSQLHEAENCRESHELLYFPITKEELNSILQFIFTKEDELLDEDLIKRLQKFSRVNSIISKSNT